MKLRIILVLVVTAASLALGSASFAASNSNAVQLFKSNCSMCHGPDGRGFPAIHTPDFTSSKWQARTTDKEIVDTITHGKAGTAMPAFGKKLKPEQIHELLHFIRSLGQK